MGDSSRRYPGSEKGQEIARKRLEKGRKAAQHGDSTQTLRSTTFEERAARQNRFLISVPDSPVQQKAMGNPSGKTKADSSSSHLEPPQKRLRTSTDLGVGSSKLREDTADDDKSAGDDTQDTERLINSILNHEKQIRHFLKNIGTTNQQKDKQAIYENIRKAFTPLCLVNNRFDPANAAKSRRAYPNAHISESPKYAKIIYENLKAASELGRDGSDRIVYGQIKAEIENQE